MKIIIRELMRQFSKCLGAVLLMSAAPCAIPLAAQSVPEIRFDATADFLKSNPAPSGSVRTLQSMH